MWKIRENVCFHYLQELRRTKHDWTNMVDVCIGAQNRQCMPYTIHICEQFTFDTAHSFIYYNIGQTTPNGFHFELTLILFPIHTLLIPTYLRLGIEFQCQYTKYRLSSFTNFVRSHLSDVFHEDKINTHTKGKWNSEFSEWTALSVETTHKRNIPIIHNIPYVYLFEWFSILLKGYIN